MHGPTRSGLRSPALFAITRAMAFTAITPSDLAAGTTRFVQHGEAAFLIARESNGTFHALDGLCSHAMLPLAGARLRRGHLLCPHHGARFDVSSGAVKGPPAHCGIRKWPVREKDSMIELDLDA